MEDTNSWWAASMGKATLKNEQGFEVMALLLEVGGKLRRCESTQDEALDLFSRSVIVRWPELEQAHADQVRQALAAVAAKKAGEWPAAVLLLTQFGLIKHGVDQESLRRQFYAWLQGKPAQLSAVLEKKRRPADL
jgi:hypothetical protein